MLSTIARRAVHTTARNDPFKFASQVFTPAKMAKVLPPAVVSEITDAKRTRKPPSAAAVDQFAKALFEWAESQGATHYTHCFQPLTGSIAEKHDAWIKASADGELTTSFKGKTLLTSEPDASSFPNGGLRATHQARGNAIWDPSSRIRVMEKGGSTTLMIPSIFVGWNGAALDYKVPLLRSEVALEKATLKLMDTIGAAGHTTVWADCGLEQEFFLVDSTAAQSRPDLLASGRTLLGAAPPRTQNHSDRYYAPMTEAALRCIHEFEQRAWRFGVPCTTRHAEVAPGQYEIAPHFESANLAVDNNLFQMELLRETAQSNGYQVLFAEKPFAGINGSGKHNNWSFGSNLVPTFFEPTNPYFGLALAAFVRAADLHADLLRAAVASAGNDHRLGGHEAPPAIMSIYLGEEISRFFDAAKNGRDYHPSNNDAVQSYGIPFLAEFRRQATDRNRTSPIAFTGNKFEFRAVGASHNPSWSTTVLNTITADSLAFLDGEIQRLIRSGKSAADATRTVIADTLTKHERVIFDGNGYAPEWQTEAANRGLLNLKSTPDAFRHFLDEKNLELFRSTQVLAEDELRLRHDVFLGNFALDVEVEARSMLKLLNQRVINAGVQLQSQLGSALNANSTESAKHLASRFATVRDLTERLIGAADALDYSIKKASDASLSPVAAATLYQSAVRPAMSKARTLSDTLEGLAPDWPITSYQTLLFDGHR